MQLRLKIDGNYQPSPQKEEKRREGGKEERAHSIGLDLKKWQ